ncbi:TonB-linked SusC/RagA family outer membrane protein [Catalinimonas alkaloidigena]|uniref:SusC/RagA family TonB-linked outer membrane protein n=1 Tax=Catalinimonas alkaloidigena TaxID=1075417 RepID=UPI002404AF41|nr:SusC/RagA family TonB-linked outer membrane protein [Catalinimonas alkaloidigena]MDF9801158.1 TonB-linked SusC/RagA family outer membrane protein [Catalinimonas alkaloidigena]
MKKKLYYLFFSSGHCGSSRWLLLFSLLILQNHLFAQSNISGQVSGEGGDPLPGVNVIVKGTSTGTVTDIDGKYSLSVSEEASTLVFSFIGYLSKEVAIGNQSTVNVELITDAQQLSEVVVTALGIQREERSLGYSVQEINTQGLEEARETNIVNSLQGKVAGVQIAGSAGNIGGSSRILIRGASSVSGNNQPLFVVDGTPIDNSNFNSEDTQAANGGIDYGNAAQDLNPDDIKSISVLKGPSAAALYGSRAANGVILITTKSGKGTNGIGVSINSNTTFSEVYILPDYQNEYGGGYKQVFDMYNGEPMVATQADESWGPILDGQMVRHWDSFYPNSPEYGELRPWVAQPDNIKNFYETGVNLSNNVALTAGSDNASVRISYTNLDQKGVFPYSELKRNTISVNADASITDKLTTSVRFNYMKSKVNGRPVTGDYIGDGAQSVQSSFNTWFQRQLDMDRLKQTTTPEGLQRLWNLSGPENLTPFYWNNPYWELQEASNQDMRERVYGNISLAYQFNDHLKLTGWARTDFYDDRREAWTPIGHVNISSYAEDVRKVSENNFELLAQYDRRFLNDNMSLAANLGANRRIQTLYRNYGKTNGGLSVPYFYTLEASKDRPTITDMSQEREVNSIYGSVNLGFRDFVYLDASLRNDWSSTLPVDNNSYLYPSFAGSFVFSEFISNKGLISFGKLRAGWARVGNDTDPYRLYQIYEPFGSFGTIPLFTVPDILNNANLKPETTTSYEFGLDMQFLNGRIGLDATYYSSIATNQIIQLPVSGTSGSQFNIVNAGEMTNNGIELMLTAVPIETSSGFVWEMIFNLAKNNNQVVSLADGQDNYQLADQRVTINARIGEPYGTIVGDGFATNEDGERLVDNEGYYIREFGKVLGNVMADYTGGVNSTFSYKGFMLSGLVDFQKGGDLFVGTRSVGVYAGLLEETVGLNDLGNPMRSPVDEGGGVRAEGILESGEQNQQYVEAVDYFKDITGIDEYSVFDASFIKLRELRFGWALPQRMLENMPISGVSFSLVGRNLALLYSKVPHVDPETTLGSGNVQGLENSQLPSTRSVGFNINIKL